MVVNEFVRMTTMCAAPTSPITSGSSRWVITTEPTSPRMRPPMPNAIAQPAPRAAADCICLTDSFGLPSLIAARRPSPRADAEQHDLDRVEHDREVEEHRVALDVIEVVLELLEHVLAGGAVLAAHLRVASD